eukprot:SAG31_NODE_707_length_12684_cov_16.884863_5_plen_90_part_00
MVFIRRPRDSAAPSGANGQCKGRRCLRWCSTPAVSARARLAAAAGKQLKYTIIKYILKMLAKQTYCAGALRPVRLGASNLPFARSKRNS